MKIFRRTTGNTLYDDKRSLVILEELKVESVDKKLRRYKSNWPRHLKNARQQDAKNNSEL